MQTLSQMLQALQTPHTEQRTITFITGKQAETVVSYTELYDRAQSLLHHFQAKGLQAGDELIIFLRDNEKFVEAFWAAVLGGIVPVPVAVGISDEHRAKLFRIFDKLERPFLYTDTENLQRLSDYADENELVNLFQDVNKKTIHVQTSLDMSLQGNLHEARETDTAFIQFSSGSTSEPKGVVLTHKNLLTNMRAIAAASNYTEQDISLGWMPLTHDMGLIGFHLNMVLCNMSQCLIPTDLFSRRPLLWLQKVSEKKVTVFGSPNFGYKHFLKALGDKSLDNVELSQVRLIHNGAEPISIDLCDEFLSRMAVYGLKKETMFTGYGLAEASLAAALPEYGIAHRAVSLNRHKLNTGQAVEIVRRGVAGAASFAILGHAVENCFIRITGSDGHVLPEKIIGDIEMSGDNVTQGYYKNEQANQAAMTADGWLRTGDLGFMLKGELVVTGRAKEIIFVNGQNFYPHDLEFVLQQAGGFELGKVVACGVHRDEIQKEELLIFTLYRNDLQEFSAIAKTITRVLNEQLGIEVTHIIPVKRIPKTTSGKIQRRAMGAAYLDGEYAEVLAELSSLATPSVPDSGGTKMEQQLKSIFDAVLDHKPLGLADNFFELGISSLDLAEIHQQIEDQFPGQVDITDLFDYQTISEVALFLDGKLSQESSA